MRKALIVGINDYPMCPLSGCISDAERLAVLLERHSDGSPNFSVRKLLSDKNLIKRSTLKSEIDNLFSGNPEVALLYFSGHGYLNPFGGYIVTPDFERYDEGVSMDDVLTFVNRSLAQNKIIILDCCHSGAMGSPTIADGRFSALADGVTVMVACRAEEAAMESKSEGVFTALLLDALHGGSADLLGNVSPGSVYAYIDRALGPWEQRPMFKTNVSRFVSLRNVPPPIDIKVLRKICVYFPSPYNEHSLDPSYEYTESNADTHKVAVFKDLQKMERVGLVVPVGEEHMYYAAVNSKSCKLTAMGAQYWKLVKSGNI